MILKIKKRKKEAVRGGVVFLMAACICLGQAAPVFALDAAWSQKVEITAHRGDSVKALGENLYYWISEDGVWDENETTATPNRAKYLVY